MKYCLDYLNNNKIFDNIEEVNIIYDKIDNDLITFLNEHSNIITNIIILDLEKCIKYKTIEKLNAIIKENNNLNFQLRLHKPNKDIKEILQKADNIKYYYDIVATDWDTFLGMIADGVSSIFIGEELGFELNKVSTIAKEHNVTLRAFPNVCQSSWENNNYSLKTFFIRPEDIKIYEQYIDIIEFFGVKEKQSIYLDIYKNQQKWYGNLSEIIIGLDDDINSKYIIPKFAEKRVRCDRGCLKGGKCQMCDIIKELSKNLEKSGFIIENENEKESE